MAKKLFRVALLGPESTGKTSLCIRLAGHYHTTWVPEYAREYLPEIKRKYTEEDVLFCARRQMESEELYEAMAEKILFYDTEMINYRVWLMDVFGRKVNWVEQAISKKKFDLYLLTSPDIPFLPDPLRENPLRREYFFEWYRKELDAEKQQYVVVSGTDDKRFENATKAIDNFFQTWLKNNF